MVAYSSYIRAFIPLVVIINVITFLFVWQIYDNVMVIEEKLQKLLIDKEVSRVSIDTDIDKRHSDLLRGIGRKDTKHTMTRNGRLNLDLGGAPQRVPVAQLHRVNSWMGSNTQNGNNNNGGSKHVNINNNFYDNKRQRRDAALDTDDSAGVDIGETAENAFRLIKVAGSKNFKALRLEPGEDYRFGSRSMMNKSGDVAEGGADTYLPCLAGENVVAMSLWGRDRRYTVGALRNADLVRRYFPGWKVRVYTETRHDNQMFESIPDDVMTSLRALGVQFEFMDPAESKVPPMMWRFLVADDMSVDRFIVRDTDSRLSARDAAAVWAWEQSGEAFQCVRDHPSHALYPVSGGMWGGKPAALRDILRKSWRNLMAGARADYLTDMHFLQQVIWPRVKAHAYCSDSVSCDKWPASHPYPTRRISYEHVGQVYGPNELSRPEDIAILRRARENRRCVPP